MGAAAVSSGASSSSSAGWVVPVKLSQCPPDGFEAACALQEGDSAWEVAGQFGIYYLPPGLVQMTIASLHQLGKYVKYYQQGAILESDDLTIKYLCYFDLVDFRVIIRVQDKAADRAVLVEQLEIVMSKVDEVASNFSGLQLEFDNRPREVRDLKAVNTGVAEVMGENRDLWKQMDAHIDSLVQQKIDRENIRWRRMLQKSKEEILEFLGDVVKKVPRPHRIGVKKKYLGARKEVELTFKCPRTKKNFVVKSESWGLWLKFAILLVKAGQSILEADFMSAAGEGMAVLEAAYTVYNEDKKDKKSFEALMRAPLLLSKEQDELVAGLRKAGFFDKFAYNAQTGDWEMK